MDDFYNIIEEGAFGDCPHVGLSGKGRTPLTLCEEIASELPDDLDGKLFLILYTPGFYFAALKRFPNAKFIFVTESKKAKEFGFLGVEQIITIDTHTLNHLLKEIEHMKFDVILGNPPYQASDGKSASHKQLWPDFVKKSVELCKDDGYVALIHPSPWRKPDYKLLPFEFIKNLNLKYLEIHNQKDGQKVFGAATRYDWYILQNKKYSGETIIKDEEGVERVIDLKGWDYLPNKEFELFSSLLAKNGQSKCEVIFSRSAYGIDKPNMSKTNSGKFQYPCVYMMTKSTPLQLRYSNTMGNGHFNIPKVIINKQGATLCCLNDFEGIYGITEWAFGIKISSREEGEQVIKALKSEKFNKIWEATKWLAMTREWKIFKSFRKDFWRDFI